MLCCSRPPLPTFASNLSYVSIGDIPRTTTSDLLAAFSDSLEEIEEQRTSVLPDPSRSRNVSAISAAAAPAPRGSAAAEGPRPPSYASDDGISYITEAAPRSTVRASQAGGSDVHPAWRPGYAMSEIRAGELPRRFS